MVQDLTTAKTVSFFTFNPPVVLNDHMTNKSDYVRQVFRLYTGPFLISHLNYYVTMDQSLSNNSAAKKVSTYTD